MLFAAKSRLVNILRFVSAPAILFLIAFYGANKDEELKDLSIIMYVFSALVLVAWMLRTIELEFHTSRQDYLPKKLTKVYVANDFNGYSVIIRRYNDKLLNSINKAIKFRQKIVNFSKLSCCCCRFPFSCCIIICVFWRERINFRKYFAYCTSFCANGFWRSSSLCDC